MKKLQAPVAGILLLLALASCKKDLTENTFTETPSVEVSAVNAPSTGNVIESDWVATSAWNTVDQPSHSVSYTNVKADVTAEAAENGLVRVFKSSTTNPSSVQSLPFEETVNGNKYYWYYQITEGNILVMVDAYGDKNLPKENLLIKSVVLSSDAITNFESRGTSKADLMKMPLESISEVN